MRRVILATVLLAGMGVVEASCINTYLLVHLHNRPRNPNESLGVVESFPSSFYIPYFLQIGRRLNSVFCD